MLSYKSVYVLLYACLAVPSSLTLCMTVNIASPAVRLQSIVL